MSGCALVWPGMPSRFDVEGGMSLGLAEAAIDLERFNRTPLVRKPFDHIVVPGFVPCAAAIAAGAAFPGPDLPGVLPAPAKAPPDAFGALLRSARSSATTRAFATKF